VSLLLANSAKNERPERRNAIQRALQRSAIIRAEREVGILPLKRIAWSESNLDELPPGEHDYFERKSGALFSSIDDFLNKLAKTLSALANTGGGHTILGVADNGTPDGLPPFKGRARMRDWLEQKIPDLLDYALQDFRVHEVLPAQPSRIPVGTVVIVIDVGDSALAPHQSRRDGHYYYRQAGRSVPAPHFYLELLRNRLVSPKVDFVLQNIEPYTFYETAIAGTWLIGFRLSFLLTNVGQVAAYKWSLYPQTIEDTVQVSDYYFSAESFPRSAANSPRPSSIPIGDRTILPGCSFNEQRTVGFLLRRNVKDDLALGDDLATFLSATVNYRLATETSPGKAQPISLLTKITVVEVVEYIKRCAP
jgi:hypothetical protein